MAAPVEQSDCALGPLQQRGSESKETPESSFKTNRANTARVEQEGTRSTTVAPMTSELGEPTLAHRRMPRQSFE
eukprot:2870102-Rhodomonas_salina.2